VDSCAKFRFATEHAVVSFSVLRSDASDAGERTEAIGSNL
jgi:hypothetical protein